jgi:hypothetical protein
LAGHSSACPVALCAPLFARSAPSSALVASFGGLSMTPAGFSNGRRSFPLWVDWNDDRQRTHAEVVAAFDAAIVALDVAA